MSRLPPQHKDLKIENTLLHILCNDPCVVFLIRDHVYEWLATILTKTDNNFINYTNDVIAILKDQNISPWHICDQIIQFQSRKYTELNLVHQLLHNNMSYSNTIDKWSHELLNDEMKNKIIKKILQLLDKRDDEILNIIRVQFIEQCDRILPLLHDRTEIQPTVDDLIIRIVKMIKERRKWDNEAKLEGPIKKLLQQWLSEVKHKPIASIFDIHLLHNEQKGRQYASLTIYLLLL